MRPSLLEAQPVAFRSFDRLVPQSRKEPAVIRKLISLVLAASFAALTGCNTVQGMGKDIERGGEKLQGAAEKAKNN